MNAKKKKEIILTTDNKIGKLEEVSAALKAADINLTSICAYSMEEKAIFYITVCGSEKATQVLSGIGSVETKEVIVVEMPNEVGQLQSLAAKLKDASVDLTYIYGTTSGDGIARVVLSSSDNDKALEVIA
ncbi:MAG: hypothetical protein GY858_05825 [Candidatus Omnitrophica bacterium]|nr:hypothetical protein [Candidatus Omnitrophota bacterium]